MQRLNNETFWVIIYTGINKYCSQEINDNKSFGLWFATPISNYWFVQGLEIHWETKQCQKIYSVFMKKGDVL